MRETVPKTFTAGESLAWQKSFDDHLPSEGWALKYSFRGAGPGFDAIAADDCDDFVLNVAASVTAGCTAGKYFYQAFVERDAEKILVDSGEVQVLPSLSAAAAETVFDGRSEVKKTLDAIDAMLANKATLDQQSYVIGNRQLQRYSIPDLLALRATYQKLYNREVRAERLKNGGGYFQIIPVRFRQPR